VFLVSPWTDGSTTSLNLSLANPHASPSATTLLFQAWFLDIFSLDMSLIQSLCTATSGTTGLTWNRSLQWLNNHLKTSQSNLCSRVNTGTKINEVLNALLFTGTSWHEMLTSPSKRTRITRCTPIKFGILARDITLVWVTTSKITISEQQWCLYCAIYCRDVGQLFEKNSIFDHLLVPLQMQKLN